MLTPGINHQAVSTRQKFGMSDRADSSRQESIRQVWDVLCLLFPGFVIPLGCS